jgi:hypothetical protein
VLGDPTVLVANEVHDANGRAPASGWGAEEVPRVRARVAGLLQEVDPAGAPRPE